MAVGNAKETTFPPIGTPTVLADPASLGIVVTDDFDAVTTGGITGHMAIHAGSVTVEILVDDEAAGYRTTCRYPVFHLRARIELGPAGYLGVVILPPAAHCARLLGSGIGVDILKGDALFLRFVQRLVRPPSITAVPAFLRTVAIE